MPDSGTTALIGTALGGLIAGGAGWLNGLFQWKRDRRRDLHSVRRAAFVDVLQKNLYLHSLAQNIYTELQLNAFDDNDDQKISIPRERLQERDASLVKGIESARDALAALDLCASKGLSASSHSTTGALIDLADDVRTILINPPQTPEGVRYCFNEVVGFIRRYEDEFPLGQLLRDMKRDLDFPDRETARLDFR